MLNRLLKNGESKKNFTKLENEIIKKNLPEKDRYGQKLEQPEAIGDLLIEKFLKVKFINETDVSNELVNNIHLILIHKYHKLQNIHLKNQSDVLAYHIAEKINHFILKKTYFLGRVFGNFVSYVDLSKEDILPGEIRLSLNDEINSSSFKRELCYLLDYINIISKFQKKNNVSLNDLLKLFAPSITGCSEISEKHIALLKDMLFYNKMGFFDVPTILYDTFAFIIDHSQELVTNNKFYNFEHKLDSNEKKILKNIYDNYDRNKNFSLKKTLEENHVCHLAGHIVYNYINKRGVKIIPNSFKSDIQKKFSNNTFEDISVINILEKLPQWDTNLLKHIVQHLTSVVNKTNTKSKYNLTFEIAAKQLAPILFNFDSPTDKLANGKSNNEVYTLFVEKLLDMSIHFTPSRKLFNNIDIFLFPEFL